MATSPQKPLLRGYFHQEAFFVAIGACALLIAKSSNPTSLAASLIYSMGLIVLFGTSALYHRPTWGQLARKWMKRFDHAAIFLLIAGTFTPVCLLALPTEQGTRLLTVVWAFAVIGILQSLLWISAPKWLTSIFYVIVGWMALPYLGELRNSLGLRNLILLAVGGGFFTLGAVLYALKAPKFWPRVFGYHELFHVLTIVAAILHFIVVYQLIA